MVYVDGSIVQGAPLEATTAVMVSELLFSGRLSFFKHKSKKSTEKEILKQTTNTWIIYLSTGTLLLATSGFRGSQGWKHNHDTSNLQNYQDSHSWNPSPLSRANVWQPVVLCQHSLLFVITFGLRTRSSFSASLWSWAQSKSFFAKAATSIARANLANGGNGGRRDKFTKEPALAT